MKEEFTIYEYFKEDIEEPIIIDSLDSYTKQYLPEEVKYSIEIYDTYKE